MIRAFDAYYVAALSAPMAVSSIIKAQYSNNVAKTLFKAPNRLVLQHSDATKLEEISVQMIIFINLRLFEYCELTVLTILVTYIPVTLASLSTSSFVIFV